MGQRTIGWTLGAAAVSGALAMVAQTLLLRRFLWRFESAEAGVALFLACWLFWSGAGAACAATSPGRRLACWLADRLWLPLLVCAGCYFAQYAWLVHLPGWLGVEAYERFPLPHLVAGCLLGNAPFGLAAGFTIPAVCLRLARLAQPPSRAFAWEALGSAVGGLVVTLLLVAGVAPDPRDQAEWDRYFPDAAIRPGRFETGGGTTFYGKHGGVFYALSSGGVSEMIPEGDRSVEWAVLLLSQRPDAREVLLLGQAPLAVGVALEALRPGITVVWAPCDARYGSRLLAAAVAAGAQTRVRAAGETPRQLLARGAPTFDAALIIPPSATTLEGAAWRQAAFARQVRGRIRGDGVALFSIGSEAVTLTPERHARVEREVRAIRQAWPEAGQFVASAGGWWVAAQAPGRAYAAEEAAAQFARLNQTLFPAEAVVHLYQPERAARLAQRVAILNPEAEQSALPGPERVEEMLAVGLADALRVAYPGAAVGAWLDRARRLGPGRSAGLLLTLLWMVPIALGARRGASSRLLAAWLAACGALGLCALLIVLYRLQMRFGALYLLAGAAGCLYLAGLFCGNRLAERGLSRLADSPGARRWVVPAVTLAQAATALAAISVAARADQAPVFALLCFAAGCAAGPVAPTALALSGATAAHEAPRFLLADALGAAVAGLAFLLLAPLAGLLLPALCFLALACALAVCVAVNAQPRMTAALAGVTAVAMLARIWDASRDAAPDRMAVRMPISAAWSDPASPDDPSGALSETGHLPGAPRRLDTQRILEQMARGTLATNTALFWE